jgi:hypothetical protein
LLAVAGKKGLTDSKTSYRVDVAIPGNPKFLKMTSDQIERFIEPKWLATDPVKIDFKTRNSLTGLFIQTSDYKELKAKNFWRIVTGQSIEIWKNSKDISLARIFNGAEFTKLTVI